jgi:hypothetical protein
MLEGAIRASGSRIFMTDAVDGNPFAALGAFPEAAVSAAKSLGSKAEKAMQDDERKRLTDEWASCRNAVGEFDKSLLDLRRFGFTLVTILLGADGFLSAKTPMIAIGIVGIFAALLILIVGLFQQDRMQEVFIRSAVIRAMELEEKLGSGLSFQISYWSERVRTGTWGTVLYYFFCAADFGLAIAALLTPQNPDAGSVSFVDNRGYWCFVALFLFLWAVGLIWVWNGKSAPLSKAFYDKLNELAAAKKMEKISE